MFCQNATRDFFLYSFEFWVVILLDRLPCTARESSLLCYLTVVQNRFIHMFPKIFAHKCTLNNHRLFSSLGDELLGGQWRFIFVYNGLDICNEGLPENHRGFHWWPSLTTNCIISFRIRWEPPKPSLQIKIADKIFTEFYARIKKQKKLIKRLQMSKMMYSQLKNKKLLPFATEIVYLTNSSVARVNPESMTKNPNSPWSNLIIFGFRYFTKILNTSFSNKMCLSDMILLKCNTFASYWLCLVL